MLRKILSSITGRSARSSYFIYGASERLFKECARQADYTISQADRTADRIQKTDEGEEIGVGGGMWHDGMLAHLSSIQQPQHHHHHY